MRKNITLVTMGQSPADPKTHDVYRMLAQDCNVEMHGILDGMSEEEIDMLAPQGSEMLMGRVRNRLVHAMRYSTRCVTSRRVLVQGMR